MVLSTSRWAYLALKNTVTEYLPHGIISGRAILILKLFKRAHQTKKQMNIKKMTGQWLGNGWGHPLSAQLANQFVIFALKQHSVPYKVWRYRGPEQINVNCVPRKVAARKERSKLQWTLICQQYWERVAKPLLCHLLDVHQGKKENLTRKEDTRKTHPIGGSLSVSNPTRALDTLSGYHGSAGRKTYEMTAEKARNE